MNHTITFMTTIKPFHTTNKTIILYLHNFSKDRAALLFGLPKLTLSKRFFSEWQQKLMQPLQYNLKCPAAKDKNNTHAATAPSVDAATPIRFTMSSCKRQNNSARSRGAKQPWCSQYTAICNQRVNKRKESRTHAKNHSLQNTEDETIRPWNDRSRTHTQEV